MNIEIYRQREWRSVVGGGKRVRGRYLGTLHCKLLLNISCISSKPHKHLEWNEELCRGSNHGNTQPSMHTYLLATVQ